MHSSFSSFKKSCQKTNSLLVHIKQTRQLGRLLKLFKIDKELTTLWIMIVLH